jgi:RHS repeat-associated protein
VDDNYNYTPNAKNQNPAHGYNLAGNVTNDGTQSYTYDATGQQATASMNAITMGYDGDGLRLKKVENGVTTYYLRSTVLGQQTVCEINGSGAWQRGYVYLGGQLLAIQDVPQNRVLWTHQEPYSKAQRITDSTGAFVSGVEVEPFGLETNRSFDWNAVNQKRKFTTYDRDSNGGDEAMFRRYAPKQNRFAQPDPYDGSYNRYNPQSLNRYAYTQGDPVNFVDPLGLNLEAGNGGACYVNWRATAWYQGDNFLGFTDFSYTVTCSGGSRGVSGSGAALNDKDQAKYDKEKQNLRDKLNEKKQKCQDLLAKAGLTLDQVLNAINEHEAFDGPASIAISLQQADIAQGQGADVPVSVVFQDKDYLAVAAIYNGTNAAYYRSNGIQPFVILHEVLHSLTGFNDIGLARALGLGKNFSSHKEASRKISKALKDAGCV